MMVIEEEVGLNVTILNVDMKLDNANLSDMSTCCAVFFICSTIVSVNLPLLCHMRSSLSFIDRLICLDCLVNMALVLPIVGYFFEDFIPKEFCYFLPFINTYLNKTYRLIPIAIVFYRYIHVCKYDVIQGRKYLMKNIEDGILLLLVLIPLIIMMMTIKYR